MYTIFVPLTEFLQNGGVLNIGREVYQRSTSAGVSPTPMCVGECVEWDERFHLPKDGFTNVRSYHTIYPFPNEALFVKVACTPIYK